MTSEVKSTPQERYWMMSLERAAAALEANNFGVSVHATGKEAAEHLVNTMLTKDWKGTVNFGGSYSVVDSGVVPMLQAIPGANVISTWDTSVPREKLVALRREWYMCDLYLASSNAVTMAGQLLNVDGSGNRVASIHYGPSKVVLFVGRNKLSETLETAKVRVSNVAAPMNNLRLERPNPCTKAARCMDCKSPGRICNVWTITEKCNPPRRIHVLLINEDLGF